MLYRFLCVCVYVSIYISFFLFVMQRQKKKGSILKMRCTCPCYVTYLMHENKIFTCRRKQFLTQSTHTSIHAHTHTQSFSFSSLCGCHEERGRCWISHRIICHYGLSTFTRERGAYAPYAVILPPRKQRPRRTCCFACAHSFRSLVSQSVKNGL